MSLGSVIRQARIDAGLSVDDLSERTSIRAGLLKEIESDDFTKCGGETYARGHLRNIAPHIKMDSQLLLELYENEQSMQPRRIQEMLAENNVARVPHEKKSISWKVPAAFSIAIILVLAIAQIVITNVNSENPIKPLATATATPEPSASAVATEAASPTTSPVGGGVTMSITAARGNSLIDIVVDGQHVAKGSIFQGESKSFEATTSISIYFSNPAGLDVTVNGELLAPLGGQNQEVRRTFR